MPSSLMKSIALVSIILIASPSSNAFITPSLLQQQQCCDARRPYSLRISSFDSSSFSSSSSAPSDENGSSSQQQQQQQQSNAQQQEWLGGSSRQQSAEQEESLDELDTRPATSYLPQRHHHHATSSSRDSSNTNNDIHQQLRLSEFNIHEPQPNLSMKRMERLERERYWQSTYNFIIPGTNDYWDLKDTIYNLQEDYKAAIHSKLNTVSIQHINQLLLEACNKDPEYVYGKTSYYIQNYYCNNQVVDDSKKKNRDEERVGMKTNDAAQEEKKVMEQYIEQNKAARQQLSQFNLEGLWVGKYGSHGFEMINVTYTGDRLIAYKVTGDKNIPRGEITFTVDLSPSFVPSVVDDEEGRATDNLLRRSLSNNNNGIGGGSQLEPIQLSELSAKKWGTRRLARFRGQGHAAEPGYTNHQYMEGQLVVIGKGEYFSFAWVPLEHQIFFGRPSPELTVRMLKEGGGSRLTAGVGLDVPTLESNVKEQTEYVHRCFEVTCDVLWEDSLEGKVDPYACIWHGDDDEYCYFE